MSSKERLTIILSGAVVPALISACQPSASQAPAVLPATVTAAPTEIPASTSTATAAPVSESPTSTPSDSGGLIRGKPVSAWKGIPVMPGAATGSEQGGLYALTTRAEESEVAEFYMEEMVRLGYELVPESATPDLGYYYELVFRRAEESLLISIMPHAGATEVMIEK